MRLTITTHHGDFRESVSVTTSEKLTPSMIGRLFRASAYGHDRETPWVSEAYAELRNSGQYEHGWQTFTLSLFHN